MKLMKVNFFSHKSVYICNIYIQHIRSTSYVISALVFRDTRKINYIRMRLLSFLQDVIVVENTIRSFSQQ